MANVLTTKEEVKKYLEDTAGTSVFDALLDAIILGVSQKFELAANRQLFAGTRTELKDGGSSRIFVNAPPIISVTSIIYGVNYQFAGVGATTLLSSEYLIDPSSKKNAIYCTFGAFYGGHETLKVTYVGGYTPADTVGSNIPESVKQAATLQVVYLFKNRKTIGLDNVTMGDGTLTKITNRWFLPDVLDVIRAIRVHNIH